MYNTKKTLSLLFLVIGLVLAFSISLISPVVAVDLPFDPNDYSFLVYNPGGDYACIKEAMQHILGSAFDPNTDVRTSDMGNQVTPEDLATHDILIVGAAFSNSNTSGLHTDDLAAGITGRIILTGHDPDYHITHTPTSAAAEQFLIQAIDYIF